MFPPGSQPIVLYRGFSLPIDTMFGYGCGNGARSSYFPAQKWGLNPCIDAGYHLFPLSERYFLLDQHGLLA